MGLSVCNYVKVPWPGGSELAGILESIMEFPQILVYTFQCFVHMV